MSGNTQQEINQLMAELRKLNQELVDNGSSPQTEQQMNDIEKKIDELSQSGHLTGVQKMELNTIIEGCAALQGMTPLFTDTSKLLNELKALEKGPQTPETEMKEQEITYELDVRATRIQQFEALLSTQFPGLFGS
jgi:hypothetical protein